MFYHSKELQFKARVSRPDPRFARLLLEQFGGGNGELKAAMQYFVQAFACHNPYPDKYDLLMDIATEELGHLEIVGATIQMLLAGVNGNLKDAAERNDVFGEGDFSKDDFIHQAFSINPQFGVITGGGPRLTDSNGVPWQGSYVNANSDLTVDLRSNIAAESRAKIVYEYLMQFTDDKDVLATLNFLLTREVAHFQQFEAALDTIQPNFPPGVLQSDPRYSNIYSNHSVGDDARGPWNEGRSTGLDEEWIYVEDPCRQVRETDGLTRIEPQGTSRTLASVRSDDRKLAKERSREVRRATPERNLEWCEYSPAENDKKGTASRSRRRPVEQD
ncbi:MULTISPECIES: manganese catalase family protein [Alistipes]|jgi:Mn-containing catalase|uniref:manganese catalase family protein n=1 Tax=Alistipes TaxID=239759 RepID=UPI000E9FE781|nr:MULTISPECIES: manganese catalase family protein [Alistipes]MCX4282075.1 manganese catalase family protein [Alistipes sp.]HBV49249.1 manganese catalase [Alistipes sp.]HUN14993.1 manganese catalase family protein [Alistipes sp.]